MNSRHLHKTIVFLAFDVAMLLVSTNAANAATLADYSTRVSSALSLAEELQRPYQDSSSHSRPIVVTTQSWSLLRQQLPEKETVKFSDQSIEVDNSWLSKLLSEFEKSNDTARRREIITSIAA